MRQKQDAKLTWGLAQYLDCGRGAWIPYANDVFDKGYPFNDWCGPTKSWGLIYSHNPRANMSEEQAKLVLGGEVAVWSETIDAANLDSVVWPRACAAGAWRTRCAPWAAPRSTTAWSRRAGWICTGASAPRGLVSLRGRGGGGHGAELKGDDDREIGCWPWDICAGAIIAQEAGGFVAGGHGAPLDNDVNEDVLWGRKHIVVRAIGDTEGRTLSSPRTRSDWTLLDRRGLVVGSIHLHGGRCMLMTYAAAHFRLPCACPRRWLNRRRRALTRRNVSSERCTKLLQTLIRNREAMGYKCYAPWSGS